MYFDDIIKDISYLNSKYYKLLLIVNQNIVNIKNQIMNSINCSYINMNLELSQRIMQYPKNERCNYVIDSINEIINQYEKNIFLIDHIEILFETHLKIDPLNTLKDISRYKSTIVLWPGCIENNYLTYAEPNYEEYVKYNLNDNDITIMQI